MRAPHGLHANTIQALCTIVDHESATAIEQIKLDYERACMEREDFRQGRAPASGMFHMHDPCHMSQQDYMNNWREDAIHKEFTLRHVHFQVQYMPMNKRRKREILQQIEDATRPD